MCIYSGITTRFFFSGGYVQCQDVQVAVATTTYWINYFLSSNELLEKWILRLVQQIYYYDNFPYPSKYHTKLCLWYPVVWCVMICSVLFHFVSNTSIYFFFFGIDGKVRLATLELACILLKRLVLFEGVCSMKNIHLACLEVWIFRGLFISVLHQFAVNCRNKTHYLVEYKMSSNKRLWASAFCCLIYFMCYLNIL